MTGIMRIFNILFGLCFLFNISLGFSTTLDEANDAYDSKNYIKSLYLYDTVLYEEPGNLDAIYWAAMAAEAEGMFDRRVGYLQMLKKEDSNGIIPRAMLIHSYQVLSEKKKRDEEHEQLIKLWKKLKHSDITGYKRDSFNVGNYNIDAIEYFEVKGVFPVKYVFKAKVDNDTATFIILVGKHAKNSMYYFDVFDGKQRYRYKLFNKEPIYDEVRKLAYGIIKSTADKQKKRNRVTDEAILAKFILPQLFFQSPKYFFSSLKKKGNEYLKSIALEINNKGIYKKIIKADAIYSRVDNIKNEIALFKFPTPTKVSDSYYSAVFSEKSGDNKNRYFSFDKVGERSEAVALIEITIDKVINHGLFHGKPTKMSFFNAIASTFDREQLL